MKHILYPCLLGLTLTLSPFGQCEAQEKGANRVAAEVSKHEEIAINMVDIMIQVVVIIASSDDLDSAKKVP